jgi:hypothetical protein
MSFSEGLTSGSLPVLGITPDGEVRVAFNAADGLYALCSAAGSDGVCAKDLAAYSPFDIVASTQGAALITNSDVSAPGAIRASTLYGPVETYNTSGSCRGIRAFFMDDTDSIDVLAQCGDLDILSMQAGDATVTVTGTVSLSRGVTIASAALEPTTGELWLAGCTGCGSPTDLGLFAEMLLDGGSFISGNVNASSNPTFATDVVPTSPGTALLVGGYSGSAAGIFAVPVSTASANTVLLPNEFPLDAQSLVPEPSSHTRLVQVAPMVHAVVGSVLTPPALVLMTIDDKGAAVAGSSTSPQVFPLDGVIGVGGAVYSATDGMLYVAAAVQDGTGAHYAVVTRFHHGSP